MGHVCIHPFLPPIILLTILAPSLAKADNEGSYIVGFWTGSSTGPQIQPGGLNENPEFSNDTCKLSHSNILGDGSIEPAVTNKTACEDGFFSGYKNWCTHNAADCIDNITKGDYPPMILKVKQEYQRGYNLANGSVNSMCPIVGGNAVFCNGYNSNLGDYGSGDCGDDYPGTGPFTNNLIGCPLNSINQTGMAKPHELIGKWDYLNESSTKPLTISGIMVFSSKGNFILTVPNKSGFGDYTLQGSWGRQNDHHILTLCLAATCENNTLTTVTPNHIEFKDLNKNTINLKRWVEPPGNPIEIYNNGITELHKGNVSGAISLYKKVLAINSSSYLPLAAIGGALMGQNNYTGAIGYFDKALNINPTYYYALDVKAFSFLKLGKYPEALAAYYNALKYDPCNSGSLNNMGIILSKINDHEAIKFFDRSIAANWTNDQAMFGKGEALKRLGNLTGAIESYQNALIFNNKNKDALEQKIAAENQLIMGVWKVNSSGTISFATSPNTFKSTVSSFGTKGHWLFKVPYGDYPRIPYLKLCANSGCIKMNATILDDYHIQLTKNSGEKISLEKVKWLSPVETKTAGDDR